MTRHDRSDSDRTGTGSHRARAAGHRLDFKLVINTQGGVTFAALYRPGEIDPCVAVFDNDRHTAVIRAVDQALAKEGIVA